MVLTITGIPTIAFATLTVPEMHDELSNLLLIIDVDADNTRAYVPDWSGLV
jgi:hypothetical protein